MGHCNAFQDHFELAYDLTWERRERWPLVRLDATLPDTEPVCLACQLPDARRLQAGARRVYRGYLRRSWRLHAVAGDYTDV